MPLDANDLAAAVSGTLLMLPILGHLIDVARKGVGLRRDVLELRHLAGAVPRRAARKNPKRQKQRPIRPARGS